MNNANEGGGNMKTAEEWIDEYSQSGPFDCIDDTKTATAVIHAIQYDAIASKEETRETP